MNSSVIILICSVVIASIAQILLKKSAARTYSSPIREYLNFYVICGYGMMFLSMFITVLSYRGLDFSNVPVIESLGYVVVMLLSYLAQGSGDGGDPSGDFCILQMRGAGRRAAPCTGRREAVGTERGCNLRTHRVVPIAASY